MSAPDQAPSTSRAELLAALALLVVGGALGLLAGGRTWASAHTASALTSTEVAITGHDLAPLVSAVSLVSLAAVVLVPAVRRWGRRLAGVVVAVLGAVLTVQVLTVAVELDSRARAWVTASPEFGAVDGLATSPFWAVLTALGGVAIAVAGVAVTVRGPGWPGMGARYERPRRRADGNERGAGPRSDTSTQDSGTVDGAHAWDALDRGDDPTA